MLENLLKALSTVSGMTLVSRITGLARESLKAMAFGAGVQMDTFEAAFRLPNILRRLFAEGAFSQAFVPIFAEYRRQRGDEETTALLGRVGTLLAVALLCADRGRRVRRAVARLRSGLGIRQDPGKVELTADMIRIVFPYILFVSLVSLAGGCATCTGISRFPRSRRCCSTCRSSRGAVLARIATRRSSAGLGRVHRRRGPARVADPALWQIGCCPAALRLARRGRAARAAGDGPAVLGVSRRRYRR